MNDFEGVLLCCDMDGTLLNKNRKIPERNLEAIKRFTDEGGLFSLATGRHPKAIREYLDLLPFNAPYSLLNGSLIMDKNHNPIHSAGMPEYTTDMLEETLEHFPDLCCEIYTKESIMIRNMNFVSKTHMSILRLKHEKAGKGGLGDTGEWCKINFLGLPPLMEKVQEYLSPYADRLSMASSLPTFLEITDKKVNKGTALEWIAGECGIAHERVYAIGDSYNDEMMLRAAYTSFAPSNAEDGILKIASVKVCSNDKGAVADAISRLGTKA